MDEFWKPVVGYEGLYEVSNFGRVKSLNYLRTGKERLLKPQLNKNGYICVSLAKNKKAKRCSIHRIVALAFIPNPYNLPQVNHINEDKTDNRVENLEWCTASYNMNYGKRVENFIKSNSKRVAQYTSDFPCELVKVWDSSTEAARELKKQGVKINKCNINKCLHGLRPTAGGYQWNYWED